MEDIVVSREADGRCVVRLGNAVLLDLPAGMDLAAECAAIDAAIAAVPVSVEAQDD